MSQDEAIRRLDRELERAGLNPEARLLAWLEARGLDVTDWCVRRLLGESGATAEGTHDRTLGSSADARIEAVRVSAPRRWVVTNRSVSVRYGAGAQPASSHHYEAPVLTRHGRPVETEHHVVEPIADGGEP